MSQSNRYSDFFTSFITHPIKKDLALITDENSISQALLNLCFTGKYERFWDPDKGAGIPQSLFENITADSEYLLKTRIKEVCAAYEYRAEILDVRIISQQNGYECTIIYQPINTFTPVSISAIFKRVR